MVIKNKTQVEQQGGVISYLAKMGLGDTDLARVFSLLKTHPEETAQRGAEPAEFDTVLLEEILEGFKASQQAPAPKRQAVAERVVEAAPPAQRVVNVFLAEEQQILKEAYQSFFQDHPAVEIVGSSNDTSTEALVHAVKTFKPQAMLLGVKTVQRATVDKLEQLRQACPGVGIVLLFAFYDGQGLKALREFSKDASSGCAYLLKHTVDTVEQLTQVIFSVVEGRIIIDPMVMEGLIKNGDGHNAFLRELSPRELEVLSWMAKGYRNDTIADVLSRDVKTIERHINNIYSKLSSAREEESEGSRHPRVQAALTYLKATGMLPVEHFADA